MGHVSRPISLKHKTTPWQTQRGRLRDAMKERTALNAPAVQEYIAPFLINASSIRDEDHPAISGECCFGSGETDRFDEEQEWNARQRISGTCARLVSYSKDDTPFDDVLLRGGNGRPVVAALVRPCGLAAQAGVKAGDRLASVDGSKDMLRLPANVIQFHLRSPTVLVFMGFVGQLYAEVRLGTEPSMCGITPHHKAWVGSSQICEERIFDAGVASILLAVEDEEDEDVYDIDLGFHRIPVFEMQRQEARLLVKRALRQEPRCEEHNLPPKYEDTSGEVVHEAKLLVDQTKHAVSLGGG